MLNFDILIERGCTVTTVNDTLTRITNNQSVIMLETELDLTYIIIDVVWNPDDITDIITWLELKPFTYGLAGNYGE